MQTLYALLQQFWLVLMVVVFLAIVAWVFWPSRKKEMEDHGRIPFREDEGDGPEGPRS